MEYVLAGRAEIQYRGQELFIVGLRFSTSNCETVTRRRYAGSIIGARLYETILGVLPTPRRQTTTIFTHELHNGLENPAPDTRHPEVARW